MNLNWESTQSDLFGELNLTLTCIDKPRQASNKNSTNFDLLHQQVYPLSFEILVSLVYLLIFLLALFGNGLVCFVVFSSRKMRNPTNFLIANLAVGDLLMALFCIPFSYVSVLPRYWPFGQFLCHLLSPAQSISILVSSFTLLALAVERYMAIIHPLRPKLGKCQACWIIAALWVVAVVTASPTAVFTEYFHEPLDMAHFFCEESGWEKMGLEGLRLHYSLILMTLEYFLPLTVLSFIYSRIIMKVSEKQSLSKPELSGRQLRLSNSRRKTVITSLVVVACFTLAWLPFNIVTLIGSRGIPWQPEYVFFLCHFLAMAQPGNLCLDQRQVPGGLHRSFDPGPRGLWLHAPFVFGCEKAGESFHQLDVGQREENFADRNFFIKSI